MAYIVKGWALFYSSDDGGYYWQSDDGWGDETSRLYESREEALKDMERGEVKSDD